MKNYNLQNKQKSTHIVIFTGGFYPKPWVTKSYWKNSPKIDFIIAADSGLDVCLEYKEYYSEKSEKIDFSPNKILGDFDSISSRSLLSNFSENIVETFVRDKDFTDTEIALREAYNFAKKSNLRPFVTLVGGDGGRVDHFLNILNTFRSSFYPNVWLCSNQQIYLLKKNCKYFLSGLKLEDNISFANIFGKGRKINSKGLLWESTLFKDKYMPSISNRISPEFYKKDELVCVKPNALGFLLICPFNVTVKN